MEFEDDTDDDEEFLFGSGGVTELRGPIICGGVGSEGKPSDDESSSSCNPTDWIDPASDSLGGGGGGAEAGGGDSGFEN